MTPTFSALAAVLVFLRGSLVLLCSLCLLLLVLVLIIAVGMLAPLFVLSIDVALKVTSGLSKRKPIVTSSSGLLTAA